MKEMLTLSFWGNIKLDQVSLSARILQGQQSQNKTISSSKLKPFHKNHYSYKTESKFEEHQKDCPTGEGQTEGQKGVKFWHNKVYYFQPFPQFDPERTRMFMGRNGLALHTVFQTTAIPQLVPVLKQKLNLEQQPNFTK